MAAAVHSLAGGLAFGAVLLLALTAYRKQICWMEISEKSAPSSHMPLAKTKPPFYARPIYRCLSGAFGGFLLFSGVYIFLFAETTFAIRCAATAVFLLLGGNAVSSAWQAREPWISKIGPLP